MLIIQVEGTNNKHEHGEAPTMQTGNGALRTDLN